MRDFVTQEWSTPRRGSVSDSKENNVQKTWKPNRKVVAGAVAGLVSLGVFVTLGPDADPEIGAGVTLTVMTLISYLVPLADDSPPAG